MDAALLANVTTLETAQDLSTQIACLRQIKNYVVGNALRKEFVITYGLLSSLERILAVTARHRSRSQENGGTAHSQEWSDDDEATLQAILILDTLAHGGPSFVSPIMLSDATLDLFGALNPSATPSRIVVASLRAINSLASSAALAEINPRSTVPSRLAQQAFSKTNSRHLGELLRTPLDTSYGRQVVRLTAGLVAAACQDDVSRASLAKAGMLEALGAVLADYALHTASTTVSSYGSSDRSPHLPQAILTQVLNALSAVIVNSTYRAYRLLLITPFRRTFARSGESTSYKKKGPTKRSKTSRLGTAGLLPEVLVTTHKSVMFGTQHFHSSNSSPDNGAGGALESLEVWDSFCGWLMYLARTCEKSSGKLAALRLLGLVYGALEPTSPPAHPSSKTKTRERLLAVVAVPVVVRLIQVAGTSAKLSPQIPMEELELLSAEACDVLALLVKPSQELQKAAFDAGAIKYVASMLSQSFDPVRMARPMWSAQPQDAASISSVPSAQMGDVGIPSGAAHVMKVRAGALRALAAMAWREDTHRKAIIDQGMVGFISRCLTPLTDSAHATPSPGTPVVCEYNTVPVLIAACEAATSMSRSVSLLRTSLIDAGIARPILALLRHPNIDVQAAATSVCCNLVLDFSPMRTDMMDAGALKVFCEHAKGSHAGLRVVSLWALKHLVLNAPTDFKVETLEELGHGWLVQAIAREVRLDPVSTAASGLISSNAAGQQVDLLNAPPETPDMEIDSPDPTSGADSGADSDSNDNMPPQSSGNGHGETQGSGSGGTVFQTSSMRSTIRRPNLTALSTLRALREHETSPIYRARQDDADVQEQAIDLIRNLMNGDEAAAMIDHLNNKIGLTRIFEMLTAKLSSHSSDLLGSSSSSSSSSIGSGNGGSALAPALHSTDTAIVHSAIHILVHISAASSRHKQQLAQQRPLLQAWLPHFSHRDHNVRVVCLWAVINLTWIDDVGDRDDARGRALMLREVGIEDKVRAMGGDAEQDVRERCKVAVGQLDGLLAGGGAAGAGGGGGAGLGRGERQGGAAGRL